MSKLGKLTIRKKIFLLTALLSVALIVVSVVVASIIFNVRIKAQARTLCDNSAGTLAEYLSEYEFPVEPNGREDSIVAYYKDKLTSIYADNREEIESVSLNSDLTEEDKKTYFTDLTSGIFGTNGGLGASYDKLSFKSSYDDVVEELERMASVEGMLCCYVFFYDSRYDDLVYMFDSTPKTSPNYRYPCSVDKAHDAFISEVSQKNGTVVVSAGGTFAGYAPVIIGGETLAYVCFDYSIDRLVDARTSFVWTIVGIMLVAAALIVAAYLILAERSIVRNVTRLSSAAREFTSRMDGGVLDPIEAGVDTNDEIKALSDDFYALEAKVATYADAIAKKTAEDERLHAELNVAAKIQMQSLPDKPLIAGDIAILSFIKPAKEVGGDLFDYFVTDEKKVFFVIADVSGKGVPAALFMMRGKEIIRYCAKSGMSVGDIAATANEELCKNNKESLFITAFIGIYDPESHVLEFARAGHEQPFILRDGTAERFGEEANHVLGAFSGVTFSQDSIKVCEGDKLLFYTDGLNEGINESEEQFGYDRIKAALEGAGCDTLYCVYEKAIEFTGQAEQFDDITMLLLEVAKSTAITLLSSTYADIPVVTDKINAMVKGLDADKISELDVIVDELINNYVSYAFKDVKKPLLEIAVRIAKGVIYMTFTDNGAIFDPTDKAAPDVGSDLDVRESGGMGILLVKTLADEVSYRVVDGKNRLTVAKNLNG